HAGGESSAVAGNHQHLDPVVIGAFADDVAPFLEHLLREAVQRLGAVQRHRGDAVVAHFESHGLVVHSCSYLALKLGMRFSPKARMPSRASSDRMRIDWPRRSRIRPVSVSTFWQVLMMCLATPIASGARPRRWVANSTAAFKSCSFS